MTLKEIETKTRQLADTRSCLAALVQSLNDELERAKRAAMPAIKALVGRAAARQEELRAGITESPELFEKPRTQIFHGIKVGFRKGTGGIDWDDDEHTAGLIKKHFSALFKTLVKTTHKPQAKALSSLDVSDLKKVGCRVEDTGDVVVINPVDSAIDKIVTALLKGATDEAQKEAA